MDKELYGMFSELCQRHNRFNVWSDFVTMSAMSIACVLDRRPEREKKYSQAIKPYNEQELRVFGRMFARTVDALTENPEQDFLGQMYMELGFGDIKRGEYFTPYDIAMLMSKITGSLSEAVERYGWTAVNDSACGSGVMFIANANKARKEGVNYHNHILYVGQELDYVIAMMCYIQISLLGCAGYVVVGNSLTEPLVGGNVLYAPSQAYITPMYCNQVWNWRRIFNMI